MEPTLLFGSPGAGKLVIGSPRVSRTEVGFDSLSQNYLLESSVSQLASRLSSLFAVGSSHPDIPGMHVVGHNVSGGDGGLFEVDVKFKGLLFAKGYKRSLTSYSEQVSGENVNMGGVGSGYPAVAGKLKGSQPSLSTVTSYVTTTEPSTDDIGKEAEVLPPGYPAFPPAPPSFWGWITDPTWVYPSGWILERRDPEKLVGANVWFVTDHHVFYQQKEM